MLQFHNYDTSGNTGIYNIDETGMSTVPNNVPKVISSTGKKAIGKISSAERGELVTAICTMSAAGHYIPPSLIFKRKRQKPELMHGAPPGSIMFVSDSGYVNAELFVHWIKHFQNHVKATKDVPVLLILDNHTSHLSLAVVLFCRESGIHLLSIPPHSSHKVQPLDRCFFKPLKTYFAEACNNWLVSNPGRVITQFQMAQLFGTAYCRCASVEKAVNAFKKCGIMPVDSGVFTDEDFAPSAVTDVQCNKETPSSATIDTHINEEAQSTDAVPSTSGTQRVRFELNVKPSTLLYQNHSDSDSDYEPDASSRAVAKQVSPAEIRPLPKRKGPQQRRRKGQKSEIITSSPFKNNLQAKADEVKKKMSKKALFKKPKKPVKRKRRFADDDTRADPKKKKEAEVENIILCPGCEEVYNDPPFEDWIMCKKCEDWWHEGCSFYEGRGDFICDNC